MKINFFKNLLSHQPNIFHSSKRKKNQESYVKATRRGEANAEDSERYKYIFIKNTRHSLFLRLFLTLKYYIYINICL